MTGGTTPSSAELIALEEAHGAHNYHPLDVVVAKARGVWVWDVDGRKFLDFLAAYSAVNQGHCHPRIIAALKQQAERVTLTSRAFRNDQLGPFCAEITSLTGFARVLPMNSGAEAVETAIKAARKWAYTVKGVAADRAEIVAFAGNFHGRTTTIVSFSTDEQYRDGFGPFTPGFKVVPYGDAEAAARAITPNTAAILVEPIQGESGIVVPPAGFLVRLRELATANRVLLLADEIQSGLGRTGRLFAYQHEGIRPDVVVIGKALGGGCVPISAILADDEVMGVFKPGDHGSTFGGNPMACAIARAALAVLVDEGLIDNSARLGDYFMERLVALKSKHVIEIRGKGLWIGVELKPELGGARAYCERLRDRGLLCKETHVDTIRFAPPLVITREEIDWAIERIAEVLA
ncbi:MAG: aminotransferase [Acidobacteria bacterium]|nr:aminotransferase [Acidobacteriota bacterium]